MIQSDIVAALTPVVAAFESLQIRYRIGGSVASSLHGLARTTIDVDLVAAISLQAVPDLVARLHSQYYIDAGMIEAAIQRSASFNLIHLATMLKVDVFVLKPRAYDQAAFQRISRQKLETKTFDVVSPEDVILNKLEWFRMGGEVSERQWKDVLGVLKVQRHLDNDYMRHWAAEIGVSDLLERSLQEVGE